MMTKISIFLFLTALLICTMTAFAAEEQTSNAIECTADNYKECCPQWAYDNKIITAQCVGYWGFKGGCAWMCDNTPQATTQQPVSSTNVAGCGKICPDGTKIECKFDEKGQCICGQACAQEIVTVKKCENYVCPNGKLAICKGDENSCSCEACTTTTSEDLWRNAKIECYDMHAEILGDETSCKTSGEWQKYADIACQGRCYSDKSKCGVNAFGVFNYCGSAEPTNSGGSATTTASTKVEKQQIEYACQSGMCLLKETGQCISQGTVATVTGLPMYCDITGAWQSTKEENEACLNNYECKSNFCSNQKCLNLEQKLSEQQNLLDMIWNFLKNLFGMK